MSKLEAGRVASPIASGTSNACPYWPFIPLSTSFSLYIAPVATRLGSTENVVSLAG